MKCDRCSVEGLTLLPFESSVGGSTIIKRTVCLACAVWHEAQLRAICAGPCAEPTPVSAPAPTKSERMSALGKRSAAVRKEETGSAQPAGKRAKAASVDSTPRSEPVREISERPFEDSPNVRSGAVRAPFEREGGLGGAASASQITKEFTNLEAEEAVVDTSRAGASFEPRSSAVRENTERPVRASFEPRSSAPPNGARAAPVLRAVPPPPPSAPPPTSEAIRIWGLLMAVRPAFGMIIPQHPPRGLGFWVSKAVTEVGGDEGRLVRAYREWIRNPADPYVRDQGAPWGLWLQQWETAVSRVPATADDAPAGAPCARCAEPAFAQIWGNTWVCSPCFSDWDALTDEAKPQGEEANIKFVRDWLAKGLTKAVAQ